MILWVTKLGTQTQLFLTPKKKFPGRGVTYYLYKLAAPRIVFFLVHICHAITDPPVTKIRLWASFGV